jgi:aminopeptidase N
MNDRSISRIVGNGSFIDNFEVTPVIGFSRQGLLEDRTKRRKFGLPAELRPAALEDETANAHHYLRRDSDWVTAQITLSTDADQTPIAPGYTVSDRIVGDRRVIVTRTEAPIQNFFSLQSARYAVKKDQWTPADGQPVELAVYHHPPHDRNVQRMLDAMKVSLDVFSAKFSPFQFRQLRILEFPAYASFAQSFANTVPYSEAIGFVQNFKEEEQDEKIDLVTYVTAHEIAHQWWAHQIIGANKQGMTLLSESFAQYGALLVVEKLYGKAQLRKFLKFELDGYLRSRGGEVLEELPLNRVENQGYLHYQKGALAMYALKEEVGEAVVNRALQKLLAQFAFKPAPYPSSTDFLRILRAEAGAQHESFISDLFEKITLYDLKASAARAVKRADGRFDVSFTVEATKQYADGKGREAEAPMNESFDVGAFTAEPGKKGYRPQSILLVERRNLRSGKQTVTFVTDQAPTVVGVDPFNVRMDRNSNDNLVRVD